MSVDYESSMMAAKFQLEQAKQQLLDEIKAYPTPISGCDAQFNHMLAKRTQIIRALDALEGDVFVATPRTLTVGSGIESR